MRNQLLVNLGKRAASSLHPCTYISSLAGRHSINTECRPIKALCGKDRAREVIVSNIHMTSESRPCRKNVIHLAGRFGWPNTPHKKSSSLIESFLLEWSKGLCDTTMQTLSGHYIWQLSSNNNLFLSPLWPQGRANPEPFNQLPVPSPCVKAPEAPIEILWMYSLEG